MVYLKKTCPRSRSNLYFQIFLVIHPSFVKWELTRCIQLIDGKFKMVKAMFKVLFFLLYMLVAWVSCICFCYSLCAFDVTTHGCLGYLSLELIAYIFVLVRRLVEETILSFFLEQKWSHVIFAVTKHSS